MSQSQFEPQNVSTTTTPGIPRWVKIVGALLIVVIIVMAVLHLSGAHGPASHMAPATHSEMTSESGHTP